MPLWRISFRQRGLRAITSDLRNRLLVLLVLPLGVFALAGVGLDYRSADEAAMQHDQRLLRTDDASTESASTGSRRRNRRKVNERRFIRVEYRGGPCAGTAPGGSGPGPPRPGR